VNARLATLLTAAHARGWRRRYGGEFCALLEDLPARPAVVLDALASALSTHTRVLAVIGGVAIAAALVFLTAVCADRRPVAWTALLPAPIAGPAFCGRGALLGPAGVRCRIFG
jgi:hypothetical protein